MTRIPEDLFGDYPGEMDRRSQHDVEAVLAGQEPEDAAARDLATAITELRQGLIRDPDPEVAERHLAAMLAAAPGDGAEVIDLDTARRRRGLMRIFTGKRAAALGLAAVLTVGGGIAGAVTVADRVPAGVLELLADEVAEMLASIETGAPEGAGEGNGENGEPAAQAEHGQAVSETARTTEGGCEKGQTVAGVASAKAAEHRQDAAEKPDPCAAGEDEGDVEEETAGGASSSSVPEGVPTGKPEGTPDGKPEGTPTGRPTTAPAGPPSGVPSGPPEGVPTGRPEGAGSARP